MGWINEGRCFGGVAQAAADACGRSSTATQAGFSQCVGLSASDDVLGTAALRIRWAPRGGVASEELVDAQFLPCNAAETYEDISALFGMALLGLTLIWCLKNFVLKLVMPQ